MARTEHFKKWSLVHGDIEIKLDMSRFKSQYSRAQYELDGMVMNSMEPFMPKVTGNFVNVTKAASAAIQGTGKVYAAFGPQGRYLYEGKVMVDSKTGKGPMKIPTGDGGYVLRYRKGAKLKATDRPLRYTKTAHPDVTDHWFDKAKEKDGKRWIKKVKETAGGKHG